VFKIIWFGNKWFGKNTMLLQPTLLIIKNEVLKKSLSGLKMMKSQPIKKKIL
jgi:hypothetical protein